MRLVHFRFLPSLFPHRALGDTPWPPCPPEVHLSVARLRCNIEVVYQAADAGLPEGVEQARR